MEGKTMYQARGWESMQTSNRSSESVFGVSKRSKWCDGCGGQKASRHFCTEGLRSQVKHAPGFQPGSSCRAGRLLWCDPGWCGASSALGLGWDRFKLCHLATVPRATTTRACWRGAGTANAPSHSASGGRKGSRLSGMAHRGVQGGVPETQQA